jgi:hypothetical protein
MRGQPLPDLERSQVAVGIIVSIATVVIAWQTVRLNSRTNETNSQLQAIEQQLDQSRFGFERIRDIYDRTEKYLASAEQNEARGRVLVVLINYLPDSSLRAELLVVVTENAKSDSVAARAADLRVGVSSDVENTPEDPSFFGDRSLSFDSDAYEVTTLGDFGFIDSSGTKWTVPKGTVVDGSSIPRPAWSVAGSPLGSGYVIPSVLHARYYSLLAAGVEGTPSRKAVDKMLYESLVKAGMSELRASIVYNAARTFGAKAAMEP